MTIKRMSIGFPLPASYGATKRQPSRYRQRIASEARWHKIEVFTARTLAVLTVLGLTACLYLVGV